MRHLLHISPSLHSKCIIHELMINTRKENKAKGENDRVKVHISIGLQRKSSLQDEAEYKGSGVAGEAHIGVGKRGTCFSFPYFLRG